MANVVLEVVLADANVAEVKRDIEFKYFNNQPVDNPTLKSKVEELMKEYLRNRLVLAHNERVASEHEKEFNPFV